jgi:carbamoyltransferase
MRVLGIHDGHTSSAALITEAEVLGVVQEERFSRTKNQGGFPHLAVQAILDENRLKLSEIDAVAFSTIQYRNEAMKNRKDVLAVFSNLFENEFEPGSEELGESGLVEKQKQRAKFITDMGFRGPVRFIDHHTCHAASAYYAYGKLEQPYAIITCDGQGDGSSGSVFVGNAGKIEEKVRMSRDDSIAQIFSFVTYILGFVPLEHEYKLMGMAPYAESSKGAADIAHMLTEMFEQSSPNVLGWKRRLGIPPSEKQPRYLEELLKYRRFDEVSAGLQMFFEKLVADFVVDTLKTLNLRKVILSGGAFMNVKLNQRLISNNDIDDIFIMPSCGDESNSLGAAYVMMGGFDLNPPPLKTLYFGPTYNALEIKQAIESDLGKLPTAKISEPENLAACVAQLLADGEIVARFDGRSEFGARALGNRSILSHPSKPDNVQQINAAIKNRDFWMPFAATILDIGVKDLLEGPISDSSSYMMMAHPTTREGSKSLAAAIHPRDRSCRPQVLRKGQNPSYYEIILAFYKLTGIHAVLNTSFNIHGEPIVETPTEAIDVFMRSGLKHLVLGKMLIQKNA